MVFAVHTAWPVLEFVAQEFTADGVPTEEGLGNGEPSTGTTRTPVFKLVQLPFGTYAVTFFPLIKVPIEPAVEQDAGGGGGVEVTVIGSGTWVDLHDVDDEIVA